ncbi:hypothetical protein [Curtobacterium sp. VKM Ac-2884]|uniref:hypothetical protein n=1 Tax=Curtobacterium sp. VKM Ac-2884 TaxID=2783818 RepID=UPI00188A2FF3|nr:hypothetical protein [Curtobacterium sp. VKM Ac-2884]MBF4603724.1 hypothetical protein [Curtobacterium sp. VKM Ac-2884]
MTLNTRVRIKSPVNARALHDWANQELLKVKNPQFDVRETSIANAPGQGFAAWLITEHNGGKPFEFQPSLPVGSDFWNEFPDELANERAHFDAEPGGYVDLTFDTAYSFRDDRGRGCADLHADYIVRTAAHAAELGVQIAWNNEFTGQWHDGIDGLDQFAGNGVDAQRWFFGTALPAIAAQVAKGGQ